MIPLSAPNLSGNEWKYIKECLDTNWVSSVGSYVTAFENCIAKYTGAKYAVATSNGTSALHIALLLAGVKEKDLVIVPNITFIASANSIAYCQAEPLLVDVDRKNWQMDLNLLHEFLSGETRSKNGQCIYKKTGQRIKAIMPVHVLGNIGDMDLLRSIAIKFHLEIVEDATEALGSFYKKKHSGTLGKFGCFSFNGNKIITTGGGGMIVTNDKKLALKAKHLTTQAKSDPFEYIHDETGYNYRLVNILAAMGVAQMEQFEKFLSRKVQIKKFYDSRLKNISGIEFQEVGKNIQPNNWLYTVSHPLKTKILKFLNSHEVQSRPLWVPMNRLPMFRKNLFVSRKDISGALYANCFSLPCSTGITDQELEKVCSMLTNFLK